MDNSPENREIFPDDAVLERARNAALQVQEAVGAVVVGQSDVIRLVTIALLARGHLLLEGDVGIGKTTLLRSFARAVGGGYARIEGSVDLMPGDLLYHSYLAEDGRPRVEAGPLIEHGEALSIFFFNEINRARPQVQALLLRAMAEGSAGAFNREFRLPHLTVFADRNRVEKGETFELAAAARDRFLFEIAMHPPALDSDRARLLFDPVFHDTDRLIEAVPAQMLDYQSLKSVAGAIQRSIGASPALQRYALDLMRATQTPAAFGIALPDTDMARLVDSGASPRGMSLLLRAARVRAFLEGRSHLQPEDIRSVFVPAIAHRIVFSPIHELDRQWLAPAFMQALLDQVQTP